MIKVILCDDHAVVRRGIRDTLADAVDIGVVAEAGSYAEVRDASTAEKPRCQTLDFSMPALASRPCYFERNTPCSNRRRTQEKYVQIKCLTPLILL